MIAIKYDNEKEFNVICFLLALNKRFFRLDGKDFYFIDYEKYERHRLLIQPHSEVIKLRIQSSSDLIGVDIYSYDEFIDLVNVNYNDKYFSKIREHIFNCNKNIIPILNSAVLILKDDGIKIVDFDPEILTEPKIEELSHFIEMNDDTQLYSDEVFI